MRIGTGYDVHRLVPGRKLILGGMEITGHPSGLLGHSDGDVLLHAICDALLGAAGLGDIGQLFPDSDPQWKGADSRTFVAEVRKRVAAAGYGIGNLDCVVVAEKPKLSAHFPAMRASIAGLLECGIDQVGLKAKTNEGLGYLGAQEGIEATCVVLLVKAP